MMIPLLEIFFNLITFIIVGTIYWYISIPKNLPPGPVGLPFLGSLLAFLDGRKQHLVLQDQVKKYGPVSKMYIGNKLVIVLANYDLIHEAMVKQGHAFLGRPKIESIATEKLKGPGVLMSEGEQWKEQRRFVLSTLRAFGVGRTVLEPRIKEEIDYLCDRISDYATTGRAFDPQRLVSCAVSNIINQMVFGRRFSYDDDEFVRQFMSLAKRLSGDGVGFLSPLIILPQTAMFLGLKPKFREIMRNICDFEHYVESQMQKTISTFDPDSEPNNFIHASLKAASAIASDPLKDNQLFATCLDLFQAGTETTATTLRWAILFLAHHPEVQEKFYQELKQEIGTSTLPSYADRLKLPYTEAVIMETQRLANVVPLGLYRRSTAATKLRGYDIPENAVVITFLTNIFHNPEVYPEPFRFNPERFLDSSGKVIRDPKLIPFQLGKRICLGEALARMELFLFLVGLASRFRFYFPNDKVRPTMEPMVGFTCTPAPYHICMEARD